MIIVQLFKDFNPQTEEAAKTWNIIKNADMLYELEELLDCSCSITHQLYADELNDLLAFHGEELLSELGINKANYTKNESTNPTKNISAKRLNEELEKLLKYSKN